MYNNYDIPEPRNSSCPNSSSAISIPISVTTDTLPSLFPVRALFRLPGGGTRSLDASPIQSGLLRSHSAKLVPRIDTIRGTRYLSHFVRAKVNTAPPNIDAYRQYSHC